MSGLDAGWPRARRARELGFLLLIIGAVPRLAQTAVTPKPVTTQDLTLPKDRLPAGCSLRVIEPAKADPVPPDSVWQEIGYTPAGRPTVITVTRETPRLASDPLNAANPWIGTDRHVLARLRQEVDGDGQAGLPTRLPDAPPLTAREWAALSLRPADGVDEGYRAIYAQTGGSDVRVVAVRFEQTPASVVPVPAEPSGRQISELSPIGASGVQPAADPPHRQVIAIGPIRAVLVGGVGPCWTAVSTYLTSLGR